MHTIDKVSLDTSHSRPSSMKKIGQVKYLPKIILASGRESLIAGNDYAIKEENQVTITSKERLEPFSPIYESLGKTGTLLPQIQVINQSHDGITSGAMDPSILMHEFNNYNIMTQYMHSIKNKKMTSRETKMSFQKKLVKQGPLAMRGYSVDFDDEIEN